MVKLMITIEEAKDYVAFTRQKQDSLNRIENLIDLYESNSCKIEWGLQSITLTPDEKILLDEFIKQLINNLVKPG